MNDVDARCDALPRGRSVEAVNARGELDIFSRGELAVAVGFVRDPAEVLAHHLGCGAEGMIFDYTGARPEHGSDHGEERALPRAIRPLEKRKCSCLERRAHAAERRRRAEGARDLFDLDTLYP